MKSSASSFFGSSAVVSVSRRVRFSQKILQ